MKTSKITDEVRQRAAEMQRIGKIAVRKARDENRKRGIPNVNSLNGTLSYELPDGTITSESPFKEDDEKK